MQVDTYDLDGVPGSKMELARDDQGQIALDGRLVVAVSMWGAKVALTLPDRLVLISVRDYGRLTKYGGIADDLRA